MSELHSSRKIDRIPVKKKCGVFLLEFTAKGLYSVRFPKEVGTSSGKAGLSHLIKKLRGRKLDLTGYSLFQTKVYAALRKVPGGKTVTYGELAKRAGYPGATRAVGTAMKNNRLPIVIPCHRVLPASGGLGEYSAGKKWKRWLLKSEVSGGRSVKASEHQKGKVTR